MRDVDEAARLVFLLAGVSYYKTAAPPVIDLGETAVTGTERAFLRAFYTDGLAEFGYRNGLDLSGLRIEGPSRPVPARPAPLQARRPGLPAPRAGRPLVPFGGGIDSIVTVEMIRARAEPALFIVSRPGDRFEAIERPAAVTGLPVIRAEREIDPQLLRSRDLGFRNGHVPVTGIISAIAVLAAVLDGRDAVVMSNEWSASIPTLEVNGSPVNHQYSKSEAFEEAFREVLAGALGPDFAYFSALRPFSELWVARRFAALTQYHDTFRSCNRAFHIDKSLRLDHWCGRCDKCCFIDLILAPFVPAADLERSSAGTSRWTATTVPARMPATAPAWPTSSVPCSAPPPPASRSSAWARSASAGPRRCSPRSGPTGPAPSCSRCWPRSWTACPSCPPRPSCSARSAATSSRMPMRPTISWSDLRAGPGGQDRGGLAAARSASGASAWKAWPTSPRSSPWAASPCWSTTTRRPAGWTGARYSPPPAAAWPRWPAATW